MITAKSFKIGFIVLAALVAMLGLGTHATAATPEWKVMALSGVPRLGELVDDDPRYEYPMSATCPSLGHCTVLTGGYGAAIAVTQDDSAWSASSVPLPEEPERPEPPYWEIPGLYKLTCPAEGFCAALGSYAEHSNGKTVGMAAVEKDGSWSTTKVPLPNPAVAPYANLVFDYWIGLSCPTTGWCVAIAGYGPEPRTAASAAVAYVMVDGKWTASWLPVPSDSLFAGAEVNSVACSSVESCTAVGSYDVLEGETALTYPALWIYQAGGWSAARATEPAGTREGRLAEVVCPLESGCSAEGRFSNSIDGHEELQLFNEVGGTWHAQEVPLPIGDSLIGAPEEEVNLSCAGTASCLVLVRAGASADQAQPYLFNEAAGVLSEVPIGRLPGEVPYSLLLDPPVCPQAGWCILAGELEDARGSEGVFVTVDDGIATLALAPPPIGAERWPAGFSYLLPESLACSGIEACVFATGDIGGQLLVESPSVQHPPEIIAGSPTEQSNSGGGGQSDGGSSTPTPGTPVPVSDYVALGDSYSAGQGNPPYLAGTDTKRDQCHRSTFGYPFQTSLAVGFFTPQFIFRACSGAVISDFFHGRDGEPPQLSWLKQSDTVSLVTLTIGGNDAYFAEVMRTCVFVSACELIWKHKVDAAIATMGHYSPGNDESLQRLYMMIAKEAPKAKIVVLGYPRFFPVDPPLLCPSELGPVFGKAAMLWINSEIKHMDGVIRGAVMATKRSYPNVVYADAYNAFNGHEICTTRPDMYGVKLSLKSKYRAGSFHPNAAGQRALAAIVETMAQ
jgi:lysophospholipase L1-like esterase